ncbi:MAG: hypothetical protein MUF19_02955 [Candidatus Pacebacteria bacterium]|jgi:hypothetical protein|nr:hypothetical protein [Candidatus Paceibacterota bacterium]
MKRFSEQFKKKADTIRLSASEKDMLFERLSAYVAYHPVVSAVTPAKSTKAIFREPFIEWAMPRRLYRQLVLGCFAFILIGVPFLAERSVPGDMLYSMKVRVNEEVRSSFTSSGYEKVAWETKRLERRIAEARLLAKEGRLTPEIEAGVIAAVTEHQAATEAEIAMLRTTDADAAALAELTFVSVLDVQSAALKANEETSSTEGMSTVAIAMALDQAQSQVSQTSSDEVSYERLVAQLEQETTRARELLISIADDATEQEYADIERRLGDMERKLATGIELYATDAGAGVAALTKTWRDVQVVMTFMTDIDVRTALALESLVPVVLTPEEEKVLALSAYEEATVALARIEATLPQVTDTGVTDKVTLTVPEIRTLLETASSSLPTDVKLAKRSAEEAREYTRSIVALAEFADPDAATAAMMIATDLGTSTGTSTADTGTTTPNEEEDEEEGE